MSPKEFRKVALALRGATESAHMGHPDFRLNGKVFATLGAPSDEWAVLKFTPQQQTAFVASWPDVFIPCSGAWGRSGSTLVRLPHAEKGVVQGAIVIAFENLAANVAGKKPTKRSSKKKSKSSTKKKSKVASKKTSKHSARKKAN